MESLSFSPCSAPGFAISSCVKYEGTDRAVEDGADRDEEEKIVYHKYDSGPAVCIHSDSRGQSGCMGIYGTVGLARSVSPGALGPGRHGNCQKKGELVSLMASSVMISSVVAVLSAAIGILTSRALVLYRFRGRN